MRRKLHINQDSSAGLVFAIAGTLFLLFGRDYPMGTATRMGPGYLPFILGWSLVGIGLLVGAKGILREGEPVKAPSLRPLLFICGAFLLFSWLIERAGLIGTGIIAMLLASASTPEFRVAEQIVLAVIASVLAAALFVYALGVPMPIWPPIFRN